jgi:predicted permease
MRWLSDFAQDVRFAVRQFSKDAGANVVIVLTLALGVGANTAIFSIDNGFHRPLPVPAADRLVVLAAQPTGDENGAFTFSYPALQDLRAQLPQFEDLFGSSVQLGGVEVGSRSRQFLYMAVTANYFKGLGLQPALGRLIQPVDGETNGAESVVVLGHAFWQKQFGGNPDVVGTQVRMSGRSARVLGVTPPEFHGTYFGADVEGYMLLSDLYRSPNVFTDRTVHPLLVMGRLKPGTSLEQAQSAVATALTRIGQQHPATDRGMGVRVIREPFARPVPTATFTALGELLRIVLLSLSILVLLLACLNVVNILLVRAVARQREFAIRAALGSGKGRLIRQTLTESGLLAVLGTTAGLVAGQWANAAFTRSIDLAVDVPIVLDFGFDWRVFAYGLLAALITGTVIGLLPALLAAKTNAGAALQEGSRGDSGGPRRQRVRGTLAAAQVAGSLVVLVAAGLFVRSLRSAQAMDLGLDSTGVLNVRVVPEWAGYDEARSRDFFIELQRRLEALPGVTSVSQAFSVPLGYYFANGRVYIEGRAVDPSLQSPQVGLNYIDGAYFDTLKIPVVRGRAFTAMDDESAPMVTIVNQTMAQRFWPGQDPIGKRFRVGNDASPPMTIIGVARDGKYRSVTESPLPFAYRPLRQTYVGMRFFQLRASVPPETLGLPVQQQIQALDARVPYADLGTMRHSLDGLGGFLIFAIGARQAGALGLLGLVLAVIGVYGVVSYGAAMRRREIGIRMALGAEPLGVLRLVLRQGVAIVGIGVVAGIAGALALSRIIAGFLPLSSAADPLVFAGVTFATVAIALIACFIPARRAAQMAPIDALRQE